MQPAAPTSRLVGRYALYDKIASGGMATVYFGRLRGPSGFARTVAVKCLYPEFARDPDFLAMFLDEARLASRIRSPYVVPTLDVVSEGGELALVMEYVHGESLGALTPWQSDIEAERGAPAPPDIPVAVAVSVLVDVLEGLHAAHEARGEQGEPLGIVHRDVSPQNIIVGIDGLGHLIDFGVAKATGRLQTTRDGQLKGKLAYMTPEQLRGESVTRRSDVFAASVVLWETLAGKSLFWAGDEGATVTRVLMGDIQPPSQAVRTNRDPIEVKAIAGLDAVVMRGLERDPAKRFETARDMASALGCLAPASKAEVTRWLEQVAAHPLSRRTAAIAALEGSATGVATSLPTRAGDADAPPQPIADASSLSVVSGITTAPFSPRRRAGLWLAAAVLLSVVIAATRIPWRGPVPARSTATPAPSATASSEPRPADSSSARASKSAAPDPPAPSTPAPPSAISPPRRGPAAPRASDCTPPFTWDAEGKKHYKRQCL